MFDLHFSWLGMDKWLKVSIVVAVLLAGAGAFHYFVFDLPGMEPARQEREIVSSRADETRLAHRRGAIKDCLEAARMVYDVHWAAACTTEVNQGSPGADGHAECELPDAKAAVVNAWLNEAERQCVAEARANR